MRIALGAAGMFCAAGGFCAGPAQASPPIVTGTGVPWQHEGPSSGVAIWPSSASTPLTAVGTLRLAIIRVEFVEDFSPTTTGSGRFDLDASPPHDRAYTLSLAADMASYLSDVSGGRLDLEYSVYPASGAYPMPHQMAWYGADSTEMPGLCMLLRDAVEASDPDVDFSAFGAVMIVHAGAGQEADIYGDSPDDLFSVFLRLVDLASYLPEGGYGYQGIETDDGVYVQEGMIVPEQEAQDGFGLGVLGTMAHEMLHQLGLPDLYDTLTGGVGVGGWDMMGYGQWLMSGFWPSSPGAWSRNRLGWADVKIVENGSFESVLGDTVLRVPLSGSEYLLIENRQRDPDGDGLCDSSERDYGLAGSGILIWHIDRGVIDTTLVSNTVNADPAHKGVDLEEADGIQDFDYSLPDLYGYEGSVYDPWFQGGYGYLFDGTSTPSSVTSWGGATGVSVDVQDEPSSAMTLSIGSGLMPEGWPVSTGVLEYGPVPFELDSGHAVLLTSPVGAVWAVSASNPVPYAFFDDASCAPVVENFPSIGQAVLICAGDGQLHLFDGGGNEMPGWPVSLPAGAVATASLACGREGFIAVATAPRDRVYLYSSGGELMPGWPRPVSEPVTGLAVIPDSEEPGLAALTRSGQLSAWSLNGFPLGGWPVDAMGGEPTGSPLCTDFNRDGNIEIAAVCGTSISVFNTRGVLLSGLPVDLRGNPFGSPWLADLNEDGYPEIVIETSEGIEAFEASGAVLLDWPLLPPVDPSAGAFAPGNGGTGAVGFSAFALRDGRVGLASGNGGIFEGFPVSTGDDPVGRPALIEFDGDGQLEMIAADAFGFVGLWQTPISAGESFPGSDFSGQNCWWIEDLPQVSGAGGLLASGSFFVYPNPVRDDAGNIRFEPGVDSAYEVKVFDIAGELVAEFEGSCGAGMACEISWNVEDLSPGLYYVCLELWSAAGSARALFEAAVVH